MGSGLNSASVTARKMKNTGGPQTLNYGIYRNNARTQNWGTTIGVDTLARTGTGAAQVINVRGQLPGPQVPGLSGVYSDTVQVIITY